MTVARLPFLVEVRHPPCMAWERIAAFNVQVVAELYARDCFKANHLSRPGIAYRVTAKNRVLCKMGAE